MMGFVGQLLVQPLWLQIWVGWMGLVNMLSLAFLGNREARWVLGAFIGAFVTISVLFFELNGFNRLLGLGHVIWWTPLVFVLVRRLGEIPGVDAFGKWVRVLLVTNSVSLVIDYVDVLRYVLGDR